MSSINKITITREDWMKISEVFNTIKKNLYDYIEGVDTQMSSDPENVFILTIKKKAFLEILKINDIKWERLERV